jgi:hypothetical protein
LSHGLHNFAESFKALNFSALFGQRSRGKIAIEYRGNKRANLRSSHFNIHRLTPIRNAVGSKYFDSFVGGGGAEGAFNLSKGVIAKRAYNLIKFDKSPLVNAPGLCRSLPISRAKLAKANLSLDSKEPGGRLLSNSRQICLPASSSPSGRLWASCEAHSSDCATFRAGRP